MKLAVGLSLAIYRSDFKRKYQYYSAIFRNDTKYLMETSDYNAYYASGSN
jgi:hypothetical protein